MRLHGLTDGRITLLSFIYTRCTDPRACLRASGVLRQLQQLTLAEPAVATNLLLLTLSFDPAHDTPEVMSRYGDVFNGRQGGAEWLFLTTESREQLAPLLDLYGQQVDRAPARRRHRPLQSSAASLSYRWAKAHSQHLQLWPAGSTPGHDRCAHAVDGGPIESHTKTPDPAVKLNGTEVPLPGNSVTRKFVQ